MAREARAGGVSRRRMQLGITQSDLARRVGISRQAVIAIERGQRPRVDTALKLARALNTTVESLFVDAEPVWAGSRAPRATWAEVDGRRVLHPTTDTVADVEVGRDGRVEALPEARPPERVVVVAGCDPALPLIARWFSRRHPGWWCDVIPASSREALDLARVGYVHVAGIHLFHPDGYNRPHVTPQARRQEGFRASVFEVGWAARSRVHLDDWRRLWLEAAVAVGPMGSETAALAARVAGAEGLPDAPWRTVASRGHDDSAKRVIDGTARLALIPRVVAELNGLAFCPLAQQPFDWVVQDPSAPGVDRLLSVLGDRTVKESLGRLQGYSLDHIGQAMWTVPAIR
jgi:putative molybdopterin biosynthesis protein